jgi:hypothetical protein
MGDDDKERLARLEERVHNTREEVRLVVGRVNKLIFAALMAAVGALSSIFMTLVKKL